MITTAEAVVVVVVVVVIIIIIIIVINRNAPVKFTNHEVSHYVISLHLG
jgi:hypothetical protein